MNNYLTMSFIKKINQQQIVMKNKLLIFISFFCVSLFTRAQSDTLEVSLSQAIAYATEFGYQSINAQYDIEIAQKKVNETIAIGLPQISGNGSIINNLMLQKNQIQFGDTTITTVFGTKYNNSVGGRVDQLLFDGSYLVGLKASKVYVRLSENLKIKTEIELKQAVAEAYILALISKQNIDNFKTSLEVNEQTYEQTLAYYNNGLIEDIDVDQIKLMVNESKRLYADAENQLAITMSVLKFAMGYDIDKPLKITDELNNLLASIPVNPQSESDITSHIDYKSLVTQIDIKGLDIKNQKALAMPRLSAFLSYDNAFFGNSFSDLVRTEGSMLGLSLSIPIFSSGSRSAQLKQKKLELTKLTVQQHMLEQSLKNDLSIARSNLSNSKKQYENALEAKEISERIFNKSLIRFNNGLMSSVELSENENKMVEAIINFSNASANYYNMFINYQKASAQL